MTALRRQRPRGALAGAVAARTRRDARPLQHRLRLRRRAPTPYTEAERPRPQSVYAASKLLGEWFAPDAPRALRAAGREPVRRRLCPQQRRRIVGLAARRAARRCSSIASVSPSYVEDVVAGDAPRWSSTSAPAGLYHCVNSGVTTWLELGEEIARQLGEAETARLEPGGVANVHVKAKRPQYCALSNAKLRAAGVEMPEWRDALRRYLF